MPLATVGRVSEVQRARDPTPTSSTVPPNSESSSSLLSANPAGPSSLPVPSGSNVPNPAPVSGTNTPYTSNPPQIFSPAGLAVEPNGDANERAEMPRVEEGDARKAAAEAALRRMRLGNRAPISSSPLIPTEADDQGLEMRGRSPEPSIRLTPTTTSLEKGKGKAPADVNPLDEEPSAIPYLTLPGSDLLSLPASLGSRSSEITREGADRAIEERLRVLRDVDEVVWGLVGELTRVQSGWVGGEEDDRDLGVREEGQGERDVSGGGS